MKTTWILREFTEFPLILQLMGLGDELSQNMNGQNNLMQDIKPSLNVLSNEEYAGPYNFEVSIYPNGVKNPWVVSFGTI